MAEIEGTTKIDHGDWRLEITENSMSNKHGYRRYHRHSNVWYCVVSTTILNKGVTPASFDLRYGWKCGHCNEPCPAEMEGYINLARYSLDED